MQPNDIFQFFAKYIEKELGIIYAEFNYFQLENRLLEIGKLMGIPELNDLYLHAQKGINGQFKQLLLDLATNNETSFFRDAKVFKAIEKELLPLLLERNGPSKQPLRIWSAASSTGQEALTTAILMNEFNLKNSMNVLFTIKGTDISERVLLKAKNGTYSQLEVQRGLPAPYMIKYFKKDDQDRWTASPQLMKNIEYAKLNLKESFVFNDKFDLILCRNVLIYQNVESKKEILKRITENLKPGGFLILGSGESLFGLSTDYDLINSDGAIVYCKKEAAAFKVETAA